MKGLSMLHCHVLFHLFLFLLLLLLLLLPFLFFRSATPDLLLAVSLEPLSRS